MKCSVVIFYSLGPLLYIVDSRYIKPGVNFNASGGFRPHKFGVRAEPQDEMNGGKKKLKGDIIGL